MGLLLRKTGLVHNSILSPMSFLGELVKATKDKLKEHNQKESQIMAYATTLRKMAEAFSEQFQTATFTDILNVIGINRKFTE